MGTGHSQQTENSTRESQMEKTSCCFINTEEKKKNKTEEKCITFEVSLFSVPELPPYPMI